MSTDTRTVGPRTAVGAALGWVVLVPVLAAVTAYLFDFDGIRTLLSLVLLIVTLGAARVVLGSVDRGLAWRIVTIACALGVTVPTVLGQQAYLALLGDRVTAVVTEEIDVTSRRLADAATGQDLGVLQGTRAVLGRTEPGDTVEVLVAPGSGIDPLPVGRAELGTTAATIWAVSWLAGALLLAGSFAARRRRT